MISKFDDNSDICLQAGIKKWKDINEYIASYKNGLKNVKAIGN